MRTMPQTRSQLDDAIKFNVQQHGPQCSLNHIDVSCIEDMNGLFANSPFNGDISEWNVSNVTNMAHMLQRSAFRGDISQWNTANVSNFSQMFDLSAFAGDIGAWTISDSAKIVGMFDRENAARLTKPNFFVWVALLEGTDYVFPKRWQEHALKFGLVVQSLQLPLGEGARLVQRFSLHPPESLPDLALPADWLDATSV